MLLLKLAVSLLTSLYWKTMTLSLMYVTVLRRIRVQGHEGLQESCLVLLHFLLLACSKGWNSGRI